MASGWDYLEALWLPLVPCVRSHAFANVRESPVPISANSCEPLPASSRRSGASMALLGAHFVALVPMEPVSRPDRPCHQSNRHIHRRASRLPAMRGVVPEDARPRDRLYSTSRSATGRVTGAAHLWPWLRRLVSLTWRVAGHSGGRRPASGQGPWGWMPSSCWSPGSWWSSSLP
jgi:hypothetical protein